MKINGVEICAESFPIRAFYPHKSLIDLDWHINHIDVSGEKDEVLACRLGAIAMLAAVNYSGDRDAAAPALETTMRNAFRLIQFAAFAEYDRAVISLAQCYAQGWGTRQDLRSAAQVLDVARKICSDGRYSKWIGSVQESIDGAVDTLVTKTLQRPALR